MAMTIFLDDEWLPVPASAVWSAAVLPPLSRLKQRREFHNVVMSYGMKPIASAAPPPGPPAAPAKPESPPTPA